MSSANSIDLLISFDTTGSMYPCLTQVRRNVEAMVRRLFRDIPNLRVAIISHGDYCDGPKCITMFDFSSDVHDICNFIKNAPATNGGDAPECYELVLHEARSLKWTSGKTRAMVMIGDAVPHGPNEHQNTKKLDWRNELGLLLESNIHVYAVQALARPHATKFYKEVAKVTGGYHLELNQFSDVENLLMAIAYKQQGVEQLHHFEEEVKKSGGFNRNMAKAFSTMSGRSYTESDYFKAPRGKLAEVNPSRFQVMLVDRNQDIKSFVNDQGVHFLPGRGFYEFTKSVKVQHHKEVILQDKESGDMFSGAEARRKLDLSDHGTMSISPSSVGRDVMNQYRIFIQSTSYNRKLLAGTAFLYELPDWERAAA